MVDCIACQTKNSLDSKFCRNCGKGLPADLLQSERQKLDDLLGEGYKAFSSADTETAMLIAQNAVQSDPSSVSAHSLLGMCHERAGNYAEALDCYERVLELNPDSALDRIKVGQLRQRITSHLAVEAKPNRGLALGAAAAAVIFVMSVGAVIALNNKPKPVASLTGAEVGQANQMTGFSAEPRMEANQEQLGSNNQVQSNPGVQPGVGTPTNPPVNPNNGGARVNVPAGGPPVTPYSGTQLPNPTEVPPVRIEGPIPKADPPKGDETRPAPVEPDPTFEDAKEEVKPKDDPGVIMIKRSGGGATKVGGSQTIPEKTNDNASVSRRAREAFQLGKFEDAARLYEGALRQGADPASTNQRLAQCYEKLGRSGDAVAAYNRAITAYQSAINAGGDSARLQVALDSCKRAVKMLGG
ncbi:MAG TPA: tetratricopeptide repeat protein [Fimbriimonadaceae bacterium]|nr:tetratricopeptide repeat protein [Fimbriimonadaceae bacterium]